MIILRPATDVDPRCACAELFTPKLMAQLRLPFLPISRVGIGLTVLIFSTVAPTVATCAQTSSATAGEVEIQPLASQVRRVVQAMDYLGEPLTANEKVALDRAFTKTGGNAVEEIESILDAH